MSTPNDTFAPIEAALLETVAGAASRTSGDQQLTAMLTQITGSIKDLANNNNKGMDPMQLMLMMMMMGGGGGGGGVVGAPVAGAAPVINVSAAVGGGGCFRRGRGKKGW